MPDAEGIDSRLVDFFGGDEPSGIDTSTDVLPNRDSSSASTDSGKDFFAEEDDDKAADEKTEEDSEDTDKEADEEESSKESDEEDSETEDTEDADTKEEVKPDKEEPGPKKDKFIKLQDGEEKYKLSPDTQLQVTVNGEKQKVTLHDLRESYSSKQANLTEYRKLKEERTGFEKEKRETKTLRDQAEWKEKQVEQVIVDFSTRVKQGHAMEALAELLEAAQVNPLDTIRGIRSQVIDFAVKWAELSPEERQLMDDREEIEYNKKRLTKQEKYNQTVAQQRQIDAELNQVASGLGISVGEVKELGRELQQLKTEGRIKLDNITPKDIQSYYKAKKEYEHYSGIIKDTAPALQGDPELWTRLRKLSAHYEALGEELPSREELTEVIKHYSGSVSDTEGNGKGKRKLSFKPDSSKSAASKPKSREDYFL
jgi:hypothetical protein